MSELLERAQSMSNNSISDAAKAIVRRNTKEVQGGGNFDVFEELFADDFVDHTTQPGTTPDKAGVRKLYTSLRKAFPDFHAEIHWQLADGDAKAQVTRFMWPFSSRRSTTRLTVAPGIATAILR